MAKEVYIKTYQKAKSYASRLSFDGVNDYISIAHNAKFNLTATSTIEMWVYISSYTNLHMLATKTTGSGATNNTFEFRIANTTGQLQYIGYDTAIRNITSGSFVVPLNEYTHVSAVHDSGTVTLYINGINVGSGALGTTTTNTDNVLLGIRGDLATFWFQGIMQEVRFWSTARSQLEISNNMFNTIPVTTAGLVAYYKLNEGTGTTATDSASTPINGTLTNFGGSFWTAVSTSPVFDTNYKGFSTDYAFNSISSNLNSGYGALDFTLPRKFDVLAGSDPQDLTNYQLDVIAYDNEQPLGTTLFSGEVISSTRSLSGDGESVSYTAISPLERIEKIDLEDLDSVVSYSAVEIADIFKDIILKCNAKAKQEILKYSSTSLATTGITLATTFKNAFVGDALKSVFQATPSNFVWYVDTDRTVYLKAILTTATHYFYNTKDVASIVRETDKSKIVNVLKLWDGEASPTVLQKYVNNTSIETYGYRAEAKQDGRYTTTGGALNYGTKFITDSKNPNDQFTITLIDSAGGGYDIDSVKVGDTFKLLNFGTETNIPDLLVVTSKTDYLDYCTITASDRNEYVSRELYNIKKDQFQVNNTDHPATAYAVNNV